MVLFSRKIAGLIANPVPDPGNRIPCRAVSFPMKRSLILLLLVSCPLLAAPYRKPSLQQARAVSLGQGLNGADLERIKVGNQAGILKVLGKDGRSVAFLKGADTWNGGGIDGREWAPVKPEEREAILRALGVKDPIELSYQLTLKYEKLSRVPAVALIGVLQEPHSHEFLRKRLQPSEDNVARRQAVLALAISPKIEPDDVAAILNLLKRDHNAWNTFGVVQFFELHQAELLKDPTLKARVQATNSPHAQQITSLLQSPPP